MGIKSILSLLAIGLTIFIFIPYINSILKGKTKPHVFSWIIWGLTTFIVFLAQWKSKGGAGSWPIGVSGSITIGVAILSYLKRSDISFSKMDFLFFITALLSIPVWFFTSDPVWAVIILTIVDLLGFGPTFRKSYDFPREENVSFYTLFFVRNVLAIGALENYSVTTVLFPLSICIACITLVIMILWRRFRLFS